MVERYKTFTVLIANIARSIRKIKTEEMVKWGLRSYHVSCIYYLYERGRLTATELCEICEEDKANISRAIEYLENNEYIKCETKGNKRYKSRFFLTEKGENVGKSISARVESIVSEASDGLSDEDRTAMYEGLFLVNGNLQKIQNEYTD